MPYARFDDRWDDHRKIKKALRREPAAVALHAMAITYCNRHSSDGDVDSDWIEEKLALMPYKTAQRRRILSVLLELCLFEQKDADTFIVHDFLDWNLSREQRERLVEQGRRGGHAKATRHGRPDGDGSGDGSSQGHSHRSGEGSSGGSSTPSPRLATPNRNTNNTNAELRSAVIECFSYWQEKCGHKQAQLDPKRRRSIEGRLRDRQRHHSGDLPRAILDIRLAVDGAALAPFVDDRGKRHDDIELVCRNVPRLEDFMGRATAKVPLRVVRGRDTSASPKSLEEMDARTRERIERLQADLGADELQASKEQR